MEIRTLIESDLEKFWAIRLWALQESPKALGSAYETNVKRSPTEVREFFLGCILPPDNFIVGAFENNHLVGTVGVRRENGPKVRHKATVWGVFVAPDMRGQKVGKRLLQAAIEQARTLEGLEQLHLGVGVQQTAARSLYSGLDFKIYGIEPHALKLGDQYIDEELMILFL